MNPRTAGRHLSVLLALAVAVLPAALLPAPALGDEIRALWADAFHTGFRTPTQTAQLVANARRGNFNTIIVQVRKRGDAYYNSLFEPKAADVMPASYDPLADLIAQAHSGPERIEIHAWIVTYNIWNSQNGTPVQADHPYRLHPDWLTRRADGTTWDGANYGFDPAHPEVQQFTFDVAMDIISRYDIDGFHFDYIRYTTSGASKNNQPWGYHPVAVERFNALHGRAGTPPPTDAQWLQFRRDQVTALVRKIYLHAWAAKPAVRVSAATITFSSPPSGTSETSFATTEAYSRVLQDWRGWMKEGILDLNIPMNYRNQDTLGSDFLTWRNRAADMQFDRHGALGLGIYLNDVEDGIFQVRAARAPSPAGNRLVGAVGHSYAVTNSEGVSRSVFLDALTSPSAFDPQPAPVFVAPAAPPAMPWKADTTLGNFMGTVTDEPGARPADGATVRVSGPVTATATTDATGFFGFVGLPVGIYQIEATPPPCTDLPPTLAEIAVEGATVTSWEASLTDFPFAVISLKYEPVDGGWEIVWSARPGKRYNVEVSADCLVWTRLVSNLVAPGDADRMTYRDFTADPNAPLRFYRVTSGD
ncbi:glycoside hydrolase family 10 protein [soil metagenome]